MPTRYAVPDKLTAEEELRRTLIACVLWEENFSENAISVDERIKGLVREIPPDCAAALAVNAQERLSLRRAPFLIVREMARLPHNGVAKVLPLLIQKPDDLKRFLAIYWEEGKQPLSSQVKKGLATAFAKFDPLATIIDESGSRIKMRDVMFLCHPKPKDLGQEVAWQQIANQRAISVPSKPMIPVSAGQREDWEQVIRENKLHGVAFLRSLRKIRSAKVDRRVVARGLRQLKGERMLPCHFVAAVRCAPEWRDELEVAMLASLSRESHLNGKSVLLINVASSIMSALRRTPEMRLTDAAYGLAVHLREVTEEVAIYTFSGHSRALFQVPSLRGFALVDAIANSGPQRAVDIGSVLTHWQARCDRLILVTDQHSPKRLPDCHTRTYCVDIASRTRRIGYNHGTQIDGWSERIIDYVRLAEQQGVRLH